MLQTYSFTTDDIDLITYALRKLSETCGFKGTAFDCKNLLDYIEREKEEKKELIQLHKNYQK